MNTLFDNHRRRINYLRISVTDRCNLRCIYCMPADGVQWIPHDNILTYEEIALIVRAAAAVGINKIRLTGGEPLVRYGITTLVEMLSSIEGVDEVTMTTNGTLLKRYAYDLRDAGLRRINISLDTFSEEKYRYITRSGDLNDTLQGIECAKAAGLDPVKIDMVVIRGVNDDEILDFARMTFKKGWHVRFIELMPLAHMDGLVTAAEIREQIMELGELTPSLPLVGNGPARYYRLPEAEGTIGFISPVTESFCMWCNRLRLTSYGQLCPCLLSDGGIDLRDILRNGSTDQQKLEQIIVEVAASKPAHHLIGSGGSCLERKMSQIGG